MKRDNRDLFDIGNAANFGCARTLKGVSLIVMNTCTLPYLHSGLATQAWGII